MKWQECFKRYKYESINLDDETKRNGIGMFFKEGKRLQELRAIYLSSKKDELFIVLQPSIKVKNISEFCKEWDNRIMAFINFGNIPGEIHSSIHKLRYNITQIILYRQSEKEIRIQDAPLIEKPDSFVEEKSTSVARKIFIGCDENDEFNDESRVLLPFWYEELEEVEMEQELEKELDVLLPKDGEVAFLLKKRIEKDSIGKKNFNEELNFKEEEFQAVKEWLEKWV